eukprot:1512539-Prymnesium_polylepis.1
MQEAQQTRVVGSSDASCHSGMPETMVELYEHAVGTLLDQVRQKGRAGMASGNATNEELLGLLQVIALDAHQTPTRILTEPN